MQILEAKVKYAAGRRFPSRHNPGEMRQNVKLVLPDGSETEHWFTCEKDGFTTNDPAAKWEKGSTVQITFDEKGDIHPIKVATANYGEHPAAPSPVPTPARSPQQQQPELTAQQPADPYRAIAADFATALRHAEAIMTQVWGFDRNTILSSSALLENQRAIAASLMIEKNRRSR
jgi:hypothetical protein